MKCNYALLQEFYSKNNKAFKYNTTISILFLLQIFNVLFSWIVSLETEYPLALHNIIFSTSNMVLTLICAIIWLISLPFFGKLTTLNIYEKPENYKRINLIYLAITIVNTLLLYVTTLFFND